MPHPWIKQVAKSTPFDPEDNVLISEDCQDGIEEAATLVSVSDNDTTPRHLEDKIIGVSGVTLNVVNEGGDEQLQLQADLDVVDINVKVSSNDAATGYLLDQILPGSGILITEQNDGGDEHLLISADLEGVDINVKVSDNDTTTGYLTDKVVAGSGIILHELNDGGDEDLEINVQASGAFFDNSINGFESSDIQSAIEEVQFRVSVTRMCIPMGFSGVAKDKWLEFFRDLSSDDIPFVLPGPASLKDISVSILNWGTEPNAWDASFELKKNGTTVHTFVMNYPNTRQYENDINIDFVAGDEVSVYANSAIGEGGDTRTPVMYLFFLVEEERS